MAGLRFTDFLRSPRFRVYKPAWDEDRLLETLEKDAGTLFDPVLVDIFFSCLDMMRSLQKRYQDKD